MKNIIDFKDLEYIRPDYDKAYEVLSDFTSKAENAKDFKELKLIIDEFEKFSGDIETNSTIAFIRSYLDSSDKYYANEMQICMQKDASMDLNKFYKILINSNFSEAIDKEYGEEFRAKLKDKILIKSNGLDLMAKEQELIGKYQMLKATIKIEFNNELLTEGEIKKYITSKDREVRRKATIALHKAFIEKSEEFDSILSDLIKIRNKIAKVNGFNSYADYMNIEKGRRGYGQKELLEFCNNIKEEIIEFGNFLRSEQAKRLGLEKLCLYDASINFLDGNAIPIGDGEVLCEKAKAMYADLSKDISELYNIMVDKNYIDITSSKNKINGMGFCTEIYNIKFPYIFGNCDGTINDVAVVTHEIGHAYQNYKTINNKPKFYSEVPNDIAEIPSKTMEHFTHEYAKLFFGDDAEKFCFEHLEQSLRELLSYCAIHEYESWLYNNEDATLEERAKTYTKIIVEIDPTVDCKEVEEYMLKGSALYRNMGVYMFPFYLISYALSAISAMEFAKRLNEDKKKTLEDYSKLCEAGGSLTYKKLLEIANLNSPFERKTIENSIGYVKDKILNYIENYNKVV